jgi:hypothetical protein
LLKEIFKRINFTSYIKDNYIYETYIKIKAANIAYILKITPGQYKNNLIYINIIGLLKTLRLNGERYVIIILKDLNKVSLIMLLYKKSQVLVLLKQ